MSPAYNKPSQEGIYQHFKAIAESTDLPIILYNVPGRTSSNMAAETTLRLANDFDNIVGIKEASGDLDQCMEIVSGKPEGFELISGDDSLMLPLVSLGGNGVISVIGNALPSQISDMTRAALAGDYSLARQIHYQILSLMNLNFKEGNPMGVKTMMSMLGICGVDVRLPLVKGSESLRAEIQSEIEKLSIGVK